jgi:hypothetical protein
VDEAVVSVFAAEKPLNLIHVADTSTLSAIDVSAYGDGTLAYVASTSEYYSRQTMVGADGVTILVANGGRAPGGWVPSFSGLGS